MKAEGKAKDERGRMKDEESMSASGEEYPRVIPHPSSLIL
jgi:hypothetical protein